jgi:hypothetical protein
MQLIVCYHAWGLPCLGPQAFNLSTAARVYLRIRPVLALQRLSGVEKGEVEISLAEVNCGQPNIGWENVVRYYYLAPCIAFHIQPQPPPTPT